MHAFTILASLALAVVSYAAPTGPLADVGAPALSVDALQISAPHVRSPNFEIANVEARGCDCKTLPDIIGDVTVRITPLVNQLKALSPADCTVARIGPIVAEMKVVLNSGIGNVRALGRISVNAALATTTGVLSLLDFCTLLATLYGTIFTCFSLIIKVVVSVEYNGVCGLFAEVAGLLATLLQLIGGIVFGLTVIIRPMLTVYLSLFIKLGCRSAFNFLFGFGLPLTL